MTHSDLLARHRTTLIVTPYDAGYREQRMGAGPEAIRRALVPRLAYASTVSVVETHPSPDAWTSELRTGFDLQRQIAQHTAQARDAGSFPILLSGNCNAAIGAVAGIQQSVDELAFFWLDAHADFHTPSTDEFGSLDCQGLSMLTGRAWQALVSATGLRPLPEEHVALVGARWIDAAEQESLRASAITHVPLEGVRDDQRWNDVVASVTGAVDGVHLHVDADVLDPSIAPANDYAAPNGLQAQDLATVLEATSGRRALTSLSIASYDPSIDADGRLCEVLVDFILEVAARQAR